MSESCLLLRGLNASNPLAFMAALGVLRLLSDGDSAARPPRYRLSWQDHGSWYATVHGIGDAEALIDHLHRDRESWSDERILSLAYDDGGSLVADVSPVAIFDLKPRPEAFRCFSDQVARETTAAHPRSARMVAALGSELSVDNKGNVKPTAFHFAAGQQRFLDMVRQLRAGVTPDDFREALFGPWRNVSRLPSLSWNASAPRLYAYRATDPSSEKRGSVAAADWLAFCGLAFFPVTAENGRLLTTCVRGGWKDSVFRWPVWAPALSVHAVRSLMMLLTRISGAELSCAGVSAMYQSSILRSEQGGYGSFTPASVVL